MIRKILSIFKKKKPKQNTFGFVKYEIGEEVKVTIYSKIPEGWYRGKILDINARYVLPDIKESWKVEYYVSFINRKESELRYWFLESELEKYDLQQDRDSKIEQLLK